MQGYIVGHVLCAKNLSQVETPYDTKIATAKQKDTIPREW